MASNNEPVRIYTEEDRRLPVRLDQFLKRLIADETEFLGRGNGVKDWSEYQRRVGRIEGYKRALDECANITKELSGQ